MDAWELELVSTIAGQSLNGDSGISLDAAANMQLMEIIGRVIHDDYQRKGLIEEQPDRMYLSPAQLFQPCHVCFALEREFFVTGTLVYDCPGRSLPGEEEFVDAFDGLRQEGRSIAAATMFASSQDNSVSFKGITKLIGLSVHLALVTGVDFLALVGHPSRQSFWTRFGFQPAKNEKGEALGPRKVAGMNDVEGVLLLLDLNDKDTWSKLLLSRVEQVRGVNIPKPGLHQEVRQKLLTAHPHLNEGQELGCSLPSQAVTEVESGVRGIGFIFRPRPKRDYAA